MYVNGPYDVFLYRYKDRLPSELTGQSRNNGMFNPWKLPTRPEVDINCTGQPVFFSSMASKWVYGQTFDTGEGLFNSTYNSHAGWFSANNSVEIRVPWSLLGYTDPTAHRVSRISLQHIFFFAHILFLFFLSCLQAHASFSSTQWPPFTVERNANQRIQVQVVYQKGDVVRSLSRAVGGNFATYQWTPWDSIGSLFHYRKKQSYFIFREAILEMRANGANPRPSHPHYCADLMPSCQLVVERPVCDPEKENPPSKPLCGQTCYIAISAVVGGIALVGLVVTGARYIWLQRQKPMEKVNFTNNKVLTHDTGKRKVHCNTK